MIKRHIEKEIKLLFKEFPIVAILGPRQSGKTTLTKLLFSNFTYISLEDLDHRNFAQDDPRGFLEKYNNHVIFDEIQRVPDLISYLQTLVDQNNKTGQFIITGSHNFLLMEQISQSLAGRVGIAKLLPFSYHEIRNKYDSDIETLLFKGCYPRIYDQNIRPESFYKNYISTYIEKDLRQLKNINKLDSFIKFMRILAGRTGQILNTNTISEECGITHNTVSDWVSILETSYLIYKLKPFHKNYNKRIIKSPKIYFTDTGLACNLLGIRDKEELDYHYLKGNIFETFIIGEILKENFNLGEKKELYFWRDNHQREMDLILSSGNSHYGIEIKSGKTFQEKFFDGLKYWKELSDSPDKNLFLIYGGNESYKRNNINVVGWKDINDKIL